MRILSNMTHQKYLMGPLWGFVFLVSLLTHNALFFVRGELYRPEKPIACSQLQNCPQEWPCCSPYGQCGAGPICVGSCNPRFSFEKSSCAPLPALVPNSIVEYVPRPINDPEISLLDTELQERGFLDFTKYLVTSNVVDARQMLNNVEFTFSGPLKLDNATGNLILTMPKHSSGTLIASTRSFLYGTSFVRLKSGRSRGVITSIVLISSVGDEFDFEFLGSELNAVQSNYFFRGALVYTHMEYVNISSSSYSDFHDYGFDWDEERIHWLVDGVIVRTLFKEDTWDETTHSYKFPETPMRLEVALWPGGAETNHPGTIEWAGGTINWENSTDIIENGQFTAQISYMIAEPYPNEYTSTMSNCLSQGKSITYDYVSANNASLEWYCDLIPNVPGWKGSGSGILRLPRTMEKRVSLRHAEMVPVEPATDFIQDTRRLDFSQNNTVLYNTTKNTTFIQAEKSSAVIACTHINPFYRLRRLVQHALTKLVIANTGI